MLMTLVILARVENIPYSKRLLPNLMNWKFILKPFLYIHYIFKVLFFYSLTSVIVKMQINTYNKTYAIKATLAHITHWEIKTSLSS